MVVLLVVGNVDRVVTAEVEVGRVVVELIELVCDVLSVEEVCWEVVDDEDGDDVTDEVVTMGSIVGVEE